MILLMLLSSSSPSVCFVVLNVSNIQVQTKSTHFEMHIVRCVHNKQTSHTEI